MGERKVLNKYYPADFNPSKVSQRRRPANSKIKVRTMLPMTLRCAACGAYLGRGTKFNARKEDAVEERYLGVIQVYRFYIRCPLCAAEIALKTDPASAGYAVESGATKCRDGGERQEEAATRGREGGDAMAALEDRAREGRCEMDADAALEEARSLSARRAGVTPEQLLESLSREAREELEQAADEELVKSVTFRTSTGHVKRIEEGKDEDFFEACLAKAVAKRRSRSGPRHHRCPLLRRVDTTRRLQQTARRTAVSVTPEGRALVGEGKASNGSLQVLCCSYGDGSDEDVS